MASDESMSIRSCISMQEDEYDNDTDDGYDHHDLPHHHNLSRLSMCTTSSIYGAESADHDHHTDEDEDHDRSYYCQGQPASQKEENGMSMYMSLLSIESFDGDVDEEEERPNHSQAVLAAAGLSSDSDREPGCYSLPATPPRRRRAQMLLNYNHDPNPMVAKEYASENEAHDQIKAQNQVALSDDHYSRTRRTRRSRRRSRSSWLSSPISDDKLEAAAYKKKLDDEDKTNSMNKMMRMGSSSSTIFGHCHSLSGDSDDHDHDGTSSTGGGRGVVIITRPKGGRRSLCMDLEEVKACRDLGFELEHQRMVQHDINMPSRLSIDTNYTTSSGGNSPIASQRISSPGDDPREVKARLKVWAQAVALASASSQCS